MLIQGSRIAPWHGSPHFAQAANKPLIRVHLVSLSSLPLSTPYKAKFSITAMVLDFLFPHSYHPGSSTTCWHRAGHSPCQLTVPHGAGHCVCLNSIPYLLYTCLNFGPLQRSSCSFLTSARYQSTIREASFSPYSTPSSCTSLPSPALGTTPLHSKSSWAGSKPVLFPKKIATQKSGYPYADSSSCSRQVA
jgi:hypothetical protein